MITGGVLRGRQDWTAAGRPQLASQIWSTTIFCKQFFCNIAIPICLHIVYDWLCTMVAELSHYNNARPKIITIWSLQKKVLVNPVSGWLSLSLCVCPGKWWSLWWSSFCFSYNTWILNCLGQIRTYENLLM